VADNRAESVWIGSLDFARCKDLTPTSITPLGRITPPHLSSLSSLKILRPGPYYTTTLSFVGISSVFACLFRIAENWKTEFRDKNALLPSVIEIAEVGREVSGGNVNV